MKIIEIVDVRGKHWAVYRTLDGHYYSRSVCAKIFSKCSVKSIATVLGINKKKVCKLLGENNDG